MTLDAFLATLPGRCEHGYHASQHPELCSCVGGPDEWSTFLYALKSSARADGLIHQGDVRPLIQGIPHKHRGLLYRKARTAGLIEVAGKEPSTDVAGGNSDKDSKVYRWLGGGSTREAKKVCAACPVREQCLEFGLSERFGIYGGLSERERRKLRGAA